jgi:hypothetical protein
MQSFTLLYLFALSRISLALPAPAPPGIPTAATAKTELAGLTVAAQGSQDGYGRCYVLSSRLAYL